MAAGRNSGSDGLIGSGLHWVRDERVCRYVESELVDQGDYTAYRKWYVLAVSLPLVVNMIALFWLRVVWYDNPPPFDRIMLLVTVIYVVLFLSHYGSRFYAARPCSLRWVKEHLHDQAWFRNRWACFLLARMVGNRYGNRLEVWRRWFDRYGATLVWDGRACRYVESEFVDQGSGSPPSDTDGGRNSKTPLVK